MGDLWRSQKMTLVQMIVQNDAAHAVVNKLGQVGIVEFRDVCLTAFFNSVPLYVIVAVRVAVGAPCILFGPAVLSNPRSRAGIDGA